MRARVALVLLFGAFACGVVWLFRQQFMAGDIYPEYSSLRGGPDGASVLHESLARLPGVDTVRNYQELADLRESRAAILVVGFGPDAPANELEALEHLAARGNRVIVWVRPGARRGQARLERRWAKPPVGDELVELPFGNGAVVLAPDLFTNRALAAEPRAGLLARVLGNRRRVIFDESHLGILESGSIMGLVRRYRLHGLAMGLVFCAALFLWRASAAFPPPAPAERGNGVTGRTSASGLVALLRANVAPKDLARAAWSEFLKTHARDVPPARRERVERLLHAAPGGPAETLAAIRTELYAKGTE